MQPSRRNDIWAAGDLYEPYVGRWSRLVAREFLTWLDTSSDLDWVEVGCGTGALTQTILDHASPRSVLAIEPSPGFIEYARSRLKGTGVTFKVGSAESLPVESANADVAVTGLVLNFVPDVQQAVEEMARVSRSGGLVAAYVWDYADKMQMIRHFWDAALALDPAASHLDEGRRSQICKPDPLFNLFCNAGLSEVSTREIDVPTNFRDFDDYWLPFLGGQGPAPAYVVSLAENHRAELKESLRSTLPTADDGSIQLIARAWAVKGSKP
jgi:SAM-dependent methyltransferase